MIGERPGSRLLLMQGLVRVLGSKIYSGLELLLGGNLSRGESGDCRDPRARRTCSIAARGEVGQYTSVWTLSCHRVLRFIGFALLYSGISAAITQSESLRLAGRGAEKHHQLGVSSGKNG